MLSVVRSTTYQPLFLFVRMPPGPFPESEDSNKSIAFLHQFTFKLCSDRAIVNAKTKMFCDGCRLFFYLFCLLFIFLVFAFTFTWCERPRVCIISQW